MPVFGWDISDFDHDRGPVNMVAARNDGIQFVTHKATEGTLVKHSRYGATLNAAKAAQIEFLGAYCVPRTPGNNGHGSVSAQVDYLLSYVTAQTPWWTTYPAFFWQVDLEHWGYDDVAPAVGVEMCRLLRERTGRRVILYAPKWAYGDNIPGNDLLWASTYGANPAVKYSAAYPGDNAAGWATYSGRVPTILQYGSKTIIGGQGTCDANAFRGSVADFRALIRGGISAAVQEGTVDPETELALKVAFAAPYDGRTGINGQSWMAKAIETPLRGLAAKVDALTATIGTLATAQAASAVREQATMAALDQLGKVITAGGGDVDVAAIKAEILDAEARIRDRLHAAQQAAADALDTD